MTVSHLPSGRAHRYERGEAGQAMAEFAFAFPLQLFVMFAIMQLALVYVAEQVVHYASYTAARSAMVADSAEEAWRRAHTAAALVCSPITGSTIAGSGYSRADLTGSRAATWVPGWGRVPGSGISRALKTYVPPPDFSERGKVTVTVVHYYELIFPIVNHAFAWFAGDAAGPGNVGRARYAGEGRSGIWQVRAPHLRLSETTTLSIPGAEDDVLGMPGTL